MSTTLGSLVLGVSILAYLTHAVPYISGTPTVLSQEARYIFGSSFGGKFGFYYIQAVTMLILYTGANTSFNGFPNLASFVAEDAYLPRQLTRRGHRLVFSNGIIILAVLSSALIIGTKASLSALVALYAIGVFVGFTMAGTGMVKHHLTMRESGWRYKIFINGFAAFLAASIVLILAVVKFTQGAWLVVVLFPILFVTLVRLHKQYEQERSELEENAGRAAEAPVLRRLLALVFVERLDLAAARALQYARTLAPDELRAVHFVLDTKVATDLEEQWTRLGLSRFPLDVIECPDRRLTNAAMELVAEVAADGQTEVSVLLPRRVFESAWRLALHDRTADRIAAYVSQLPNANATIVPYPLGKKRKRLVQHRAGSSESYVSGSDSFDERTETGSGGGRDGWISRTGRRGRRNAGDRPDWTPPPAVPAGDVLPDPGRALAEAAGRPEPSLSASSSGGEVSAGAGDGAQKASHDAGAYDAGGPGRVPSAGVDPPPGPAATLIPGRVMLTGGHPQRVRSRARGASGTRGRAEASAARPNAGRPPESPRPAGERLGRAGSPPGTTRISDLQPRQRARVEGRVRSVRVQAGGGVPSVECVLSDGAASILLVFQGRRRVPGIEPGARLIVEGMVGARGRRLAMMNPLFTITRTVDGPDAGPPATGPARR